MDESNVQSSKPKRIIRVVRPSTETKLFTGLSSSKNPKHLPLKDYLILFSL